MVEVVVFTEGQTEEQFIKQVIAPMLLPLAVFVKPQLLNTSRDARGGAVSFERLQFNARNTLKMRSSPILTTFIDLYALDTKFPAFEESKSQIDMLKRVACLEEALHKAIIKHVECRPERFIPHIQPYEFEGLLFSDVNALCRTEPSWSNALKRLTEVRNEFISPEHINDGYDTKPSKRLGDILNPKYRKTRHGPLAVKQITLTVIEAQCVHFHSWLDRLRALSAVKER